MGHNHVSSGFALARWIGLVMGLPALIAVILLGKDTLMVIERINEDALKRETIALERGLNLLGELNAAEVLSQSMRSDAFRKIVMANEPDWMREQLGSAALSPDGVQQFVVIDPNGRAIFSSADEGEPPPQSVSGLLAAAAPSISQARALYRTARVAGSNFGARLPGAMTDGLYVNDIVKFDGRPAMITVSPITPGSSAQTTPDEPTLLLGVQLMTNAMFNKLEALSHISGLRHTVGPQAGVNRGHTHAIRDSKGNVVTKVTWDFAPPGYTILRAALPAIGVSLVLIAVLTLLAAMTMRRMTRRLAESEAAAVYASRHDAATGLANRGWFMRVFSDLLTPASSKGEIRAVLLIDCDHFKSINDTLGHAAGDAVLKAVAVRLNALGPQIGIAARLGGDEFAVVTAPLAQPEDAAQQVRDISDALTASVLYESYVIMVGVSVGAAVFEAPSNLSIDTWLARADMALYRAKREGRGCVRVYDSELDTSDLPLLPNARSPANDRSHAPEHAA